MVFQWSLNDSRSPQVSRTLLSIMAVFNNAVVWMVSTRSPTSKSYRPFNYHLVKSITQNWYNCHLHIPQFFQFFSKVKVLISLFTFFQFYSVVCRDSKVDNVAVLLLFVTWKHENACKLLVLDRNTLNHRAVCKPITFIAWNWWLEIIASKTFCFIHIIHFHSSQNKSIYY